MQTKLGLLNLIMQLSLFSANNAMSRLPFTTDNRRLRLFNNPCRFINPRNLKSRKPQKISAARRLITLKLDGHVKALATTTTTVSARTQARI